MKTLHCLFFLFFIILIAGCPAPKENYVVVNTSEEVLQLNYEIVNCSDNPNWEIWTPKVLSHDDLLKGQAWSENLPTNLYSLSLIKEKDEKMGRECNVALYKISVPKETAVRMVLDDLSAVNQIRYLKMEGVKGMVVFKGANLTLRDCFENFKASTFGDNQNVMWF